MSGAKYEPPVRHYNIPRLHAANEVYIRISPYLAGALVAFFLFMAWDAVSVLLGAIQHALPTWWTK